MPSADSVYALDAFTGNDQDPHELFRQEILAGLRLRNKQLPCKYFYDERGSRLFEEICELPEYYLTRTELAIMHQHAAEMGEQIGPGVLLVEYGSGSSIKTRILLGHLPAPVAYVPVDISHDHLHATAAELRSEFSDLEVLPVTADFTDDFQLPIPDRQPTHAAVYFPGSTIGNFEPATARRLLERIAPLCGTGGGLLLGIDLKKNPQILNQAYNDSQGITAEFNLNLLHRINEELDADIDVTQFRHHAEFQEQESRVEISLISCCDQEFTICDESFFLAAGEKVLTEYSHKYEIEEFAGLARQAGLILKRTWTDDAGYFAVLHFAVADEFAANNLDSGGSDAAD